MSAGRSDVPQTIGLVGVGTIGSAVIRGLCSSTTPPKKVVISPRGAQKAAALAAEFPGVVQIAATNQDVVDSADFIIVAVLFKQVKEVLKELKFRASQTVLSLVVMLKIDDLKECVAPAASCAVAAPLPAVAQRQGATILVPSGGPAEAIFNVLGTCVAVDNQAQFQRMVCCTALMGDFYKRQVTMQQWLVSEGVPEVQAAAWAGATYMTFAADSAKPGAHDLQHLVDEQTPGGLNEMVWRQQEEDGNYEAIKHSLSSVLHRLNAGAVDPELAPAAKRRKSAL